MTVPVPTTLSKERNLHPLRLGWTHGGWRERFFVAYLGAYTVGGVGGFAVLGPTRVPFEMLASYAYALTFGMVGLWPLWFGGFILSRPVLRTLVELPDVDDTRRRLFATLLEYTERYGIKGRFPGLDRWMYFLSVLNAAVLPLSLLFVGTAGYSGDPYHVSPTVLYAAAWIFAVYIPVLAWSVHLQNRFARTAAERGFPLRELTRNAQNMPRQARRRRLRGT